MKLAFDQISKLGSRSMTHADWMAVEREFNRGEQAWDGDTMGAGRWSRWRRGSCEGHSLEFGFLFRFDISPGPRSNGIHPDHWRASARSGSLGQFLTLEAAAQACESEARRLVEEATAREGARGDMILALDHWKQYLALPHRFRSRKTAVRRQRQTRPASAFCGSGLLSSLTLKRSLH